MTTIGSFYKQSLILDISLTQAKKIFEILWYKGLNKKPPPWIGANSPLIIKTNEADNLKAAGMGTCLFYHPGNHGGKCGLCHDSGHVDIKPAAPAGGKQNYATIAHTNSQQSDYQTHDRDGDDGGGSGDGGGGGSGGGGGGSGSATNKPKLSMAEASERVFGWTWHGQVSAIYGTYVWTNFYVPTSIVCSVEIMCQPQTKGNGSLFANSLASYSNPHNMASHSCFYPENFHITLNTRRFEESGGMTTSKYCVIPSRYLRINKDGSNTLSLILGSDQLPPLALPDSMPDWCEAPVKGLSYTNNIGSAGRALSIWFDKTKMYLRKTWDFHYCTNP